MKMIEDQTKVGDTPCITFTENTDGEDYLNIVSEDGCHSQLGKVGGPQTVSLQTPDSGGNTCMLPRIVAHEMLHALGLYNFNFVQIIKNHIFFNDLIKD